MLAIRSIRAAGLAAALTAVVALTSALSAADKPKEARKKGAEKAVAKARAKQAARVKAAIRKFNEEAAEQAATAQKAKEAKKSAAKLATEKSAAAKSAAAKAKSATKATPAAATKYGKSTNAAAAEPPLRTIAPVQPAAAAAEVDQLLISAIPAIASTAALRTRDEVFLRRVSLDIAGRLPTPTEITAFALDASSAKRAAAVERLLAEDGYGENWGRYWRDVIMYRKSEDRAMVVAPALEQYLTTEFNKNTPWDEITRSFITATGDVRENGATAVFMAQMGDTSDITAEISRIFTGIQIQCAQCHNHPTDRWQRTQFHELAAFFPRIAVRPKRDTMPPTFEVLSADNAPRARRPNNAQARGSLEHYMPDLQNPSAQGTLMQPVFFVTGKQVDPGMKDMERRETIAQWITSLENPWFAKAFVNRMWSELVGEGFYEPVDDIGPDREATAPNTLDYLAAEFAANKYDIKWLFRTITSTDAYQRESRSRRAPGGTPMLANVAQRLRGDQLYTAITSVLGGPLNMPGAAGRGRFGPGRDPRFPFNAIFGFDPSVRRDDVAGSIPQALVVMNSSQLAAGIGGNRRGTLLGQLLEEQKDDEAVAVELYLRALAREPAKDELAMCLAHVKQSGSRSEGFEDVLWALLNSAEFMYRN